MPLGARTSEQAQVRVTFEPTSFALLPGWESDNHLEAFAAFVRGAPALRRAAAGPQSGKTHHASAALLKIVEEASSRATALSSASDAKAFFERHFVPHRIGHTGASGLFTGYYEPVLHAARKPDARFHVPILRRPADLVNLVREEERGALADGGLTHARQTATGVEPFPTRPEIEDGALAGQGLEFLWLADPVDTFFMHIQGSGRLRLPDGSTLRVTYDGKNGHPYTSVGRYLIDAGHFTPEDMTLDALKVWLAADPDRGRKVMQENRSYIFFRELEDETQGPLGALEIPLSDGRSLAVDTAFHALGTPIYVSAPTLTPWPEKESFARLMIAQDVGSAIRGPERGDIYFGSGAEAGRLAGGTKHPGSFTVLLPRGSAVS